MRRRKLIRLVVAAGVGTLLAWAAFSLDGAGTSGIATVIDGDTLELHGQRIRLLGIDAPEAGQWCHRDGKPYP